jgi:predicted phosphodiesterase
MSFAGKKVFASAVMLAAIAFLAVGGARETAESAAPRQTSASPQMRPPQGQRRGKEAKAGQRARDPHPAGAFLTDVPDHPFDVVLGRPTASSVTISVLFYANAEGAVFYGTESGQYASRTPARRFTAGQPLELVLNDLRHDTRYYYQLRYRSSPSAAVEQAEEGTFHTARPRGAGFTFTIQADSHLDERTSPELYKRTLANALADKPDVHVDLGDTFMPDKHPSRETAAKQYLAQRFYFGLIGRSAPVYLVLGNHDGEGSRYYEGRADSLAVWPNTLRKLYFPNPVPDRFYTGNETKEPFLGLLQNYYAWQWGDALLVVLDPFWSTPRQRGVDDNWSRTLGPVQYQWLKRTLQQSRAAFKFVFIHHLVGGASKEGRGGVEAAGFYEWGGRNADGKDAFREKRPGWPMPIHQLLLQHRVAVVFHGHDHLYAKQDLDGIVYQEVPQPATPAGGKSRIAEEYGYAQGVILGSAGHLRVSVGPSRATVDYVRAFLADDDRSDRRNGTVADSYALTPRLR